MYSVWTQHLKDPEDKTQFESSLRNSKWVLDQLKDILTNMETSLHRSEISPKSYDCVNWAYRQAHSNGFNQCLTAIKNIINLDQRENINDRLTPTVRPDPGA